MKTRKKLILPKSLRIESVNYAFYEGPVYHIKGSLNDLLEVGLIARDNQGKLIGGPGIRNIVVFENLELSIEMLADYLIRLDPYFMRFIDKCTSDEAEGIQK